MKQKIIALVVALAGPALAAPGGDIDTMPIGTYVCELPGDVTGPAGHHVAGEDFVIVNASSYRADGTMGSYLLTGDTMVMTSGRRSGKRYHRISDGFLRLTTPTGEDGDLRCVRQTRNNS